MQRKLINIIILLILLSNFSNCQWYGPGDVSDPAVEESFCQYWNYLYDENQSPYGHSQCLTSCQCDGQRTCYEGCCTGWPRYAIQTGMPGGDECLTPTFTGQGYGTEASRGYQCSTNCECGGNRFCTSAGWCHGTNRYGEACLNQQFQTAQNDISQLQLQNQTEEQWKEEQCGCENLFTYAWQMVFQQITEQDTKLQICTKLINQGQSQAAKTVCSGQSVCSYIVNEATDIITEPTVEQPMREICVQMLTVIEDFTGVQVSQLIAKGYNESTNIILQGAKIVCGELTCGTQQTTEKCTSTDQNGAQFTQATVNGLCELKEYTQEFSDSLCSYLLLSNLLITLIFTIIFV